MCSCIRTEKATPTAARPAAQRISVTVGGSYWATFFAYSWGVVQDQRARRRVLTLYDGEIMVGAALDEGPQPYCVTFPAGVRIDATMKIEKIHRTGDDIQWVTFGFIADEVLVEPISFVGIL